MYPRSHTHDLRSSPDWFVSIEFCNVNGYDAPVFTLDVGIPSFGFGLGEITPRLILKGARPIGAFTCFLAGRITIQQYAESARGTQEPISCTD